MKKVIYINCFLDPWVKVAEKMMTDHGFEPVYWVGYKEEKDTEEIITKKFPNAIFQYDVDAWKGVFPSIIKEKASSSYIDIDFLRKYASEELQAIKMMERLDADRYSFNCMERTTFFQKLLKYWSACIDLLRPDLVITPAVPHRVYDYVLFLLCCHRNIPFLAFDHTAFNARFIILKNNIFSIGDMFLNDYLQEEEKEPSSLVVPEDMLKRFNDVKCDYDVAKPYYMNSEDQKSQRWSGAFRIARHMIGEALTSRRKNLFGKDGELKMWASTYYKKGKYIPLENGNYPVTLFYKRYVQNNRYKKELKKYYDTLTTKPDYNVPYVVYFLHYQPEATSSPTGNIFVNQFLCIETLLKNLPENYCIYVKEHPHQLMPHREGHMSRMKEMYEFLIRNPRVKLMRIEESSFELLKNSEAVGTICGTVGWESIVREKPVVLFGFSWYENYKGVLRITDDESAKKIQEFIESYKYDEQSLMAYLSAVGKNTKVAYYYKAYHKNELGISEEECINNIIDSILEKYNS